MTRTQRSTLVFAAIIVAEGVLIAWSQGWRGFLGFASFIALEILSMGVVVLLFRIIYLIVGRIVGFHFYQLPVGPMIITREQEGVRIRRRMKSASSDVLTLSSNERDLPRRLIILLSAYPIASLIVGVLLELLCIILWRFRDYPLFGWSVLQVTALFAFFICFSTWRTPQSNRTPNNRARITMLQQNGLEAERYCAWMLITEAWYSGLRPRDWPLHWVRAVSTLHDDSRDEFGVVINYYYWALDCGDLTQAGYALARMFALYEMHQPAYKDDVFSEAAYYQAWIHQDARTARWYFDQVQWKRQEERTRLRVEAAILLAEGMPREAFERASRAIAIPKHKTQQAGFAVAERDWLSALMQRALDSTSQPYPYPYLATW